MQTDEGVVYAVGLSDAERSAVASRDSVASVSTVDPDAAAERTGSAAAVVAAHDPPGVDAAQFAGRVRTADEAVPLVCVADGDDALAADAVAAGADRYVPRTRGPDAVAEAVADAIPVGRRRRTLNLESDILSELLRHAPFEIYAKDDEARHLRSTKTIRHDAVGERETDLFDEPRSAVIEREDESVLDRETPMEGVLSRYEVDASDIDDHEAGWIRSWKYPWYDGDGSLRGLVGFTQDVTGFQETQQELRRKNELLSKFASVVTHDLRNPLNVANGNLALARESGDPAHFDAVEQSLDRIDEIIDDLVRLTRESHSVADEAPISIADAARAAWDTVETGGATLHVRVEDELVRADEGPLQQVLENLFRNAVEHVGSDVTITVGLVDGGFYVADDGPGLPPDLRQRLNTGEFDTGGLGLNIVRTIADRHGWQFRAEESDSGGARFEFRDSLVVTRPGTVSADRRPVTLDSATAVGEFADGDAHTEDGRWIVTGTGRNLWRTVNEFYFVYGAVTGDADMVARVADFEAQKGKAKTGLIVRDGLDEGAPHAYVGTTLGEGAETLWQLEQDAGTQSRTFESETTLPCWFRLKRSGDTVTVFRSADGENWEALDEQTVPLGERALYGLAVCSHDDGESATAVFEDVSLDAVTWE
ncbi:MAG: ATP-binding protein [Halobacteriaceae archaeon]